MNVKILDDFEMIGEKAWDDLAAKAPTASICQTWAWQRAWWRAHGAPGRALVLVVVYNDAELCVILPLVREDKVLRFVGDGDADRLDLIYDPGHPAGFAAVWPALKTGGGFDRIELNALPDASPTWRYLKAGLEVDGLFPLSVSKGPLLGLVLDGREERLRRMMQAGAMAKHAGIFASKGRVRVTHAAAPDAMALPWKEFFVQHVHRWSAHRQPSLFISRAARDLFRYLAQANGLGSGLIFTTVFLNDKPAAFHLGFLWGKVFYSCASSFDIALKRFSPDDVICRELVTYALQRGCREIVFIAADEPAVKRFAERTGTARSVRIFHSRREKWVQKFACWVARVPFTRGMLDLAAEAAQTLVVLFLRKKIIGQERRKFDGMGSFADFHARPAPGHAAREGVARPEVELLRRLRPELKDIRMLDMGAGMGRTSIYFAPAVRSYAAFDLAASVVMAARACLDDHADPQHIFVADPRRMGFSGDGAYDLVLFGGDGIDEVAPEDRARILKEVQRVGREGAWFCFSSRNLQSLTVRVFFGPRDLLRRLRRRLLMAAANQDYKCLRRQPSAVLLDHTGGYRLPVCYVTPREQVRVLKESGFHDVRVFSSRTGLEVRDWRRWDKLVDDSVYYLCRV